MTALGPAGEILRLAGDRAAHLHEDIDAALRDGLAEYVGRFGVSAPASTWIVSAAAARPRACSCATWWRRRSRSSAKRMLS